MNKRQKKKFASKGFQKKYDYIIKELLYMDRYVRRYKKRYGTDFFMNQYRALTFYPSFDQVNKEAMEIEFRTMKVDSLTIEELVERFKDVVKQQIGIIESRTIEKGISDEQETEEEICEEIRL